MPALSKLQRWNMALAEIRAGEVMAEAEDSLEAQECRRFYPQVISEMLEEKDFSFQTRRVALAELASNDRPNEWLHAYSLPSNMASPIRVLPDLNALGLGYPIPLAGEPYAETWALEGSFIETPYIIEGTTLYSNVEGATLEYSIGDIDGIALSALIDRAITLELASRLAIPVKADRELKRDLYGQAEVAWQRARADDRNRHPVQDGQYVSEAMLVRQGGPA